MSRTGSNFTKGLSVYGVPILPTVGNETTTGNIFFVNSGEPDGADDVGTSGKTKQKPFITIDYAIGQCTANNGDVIYVMPGHAETITSRSDIVPDVAGISIIGLGNGDDRPVITYGNSGAGDSSGLTTTIAITGDGTRVSNMIFNCGSTATKVKSRYGMRLQAPNIQIDTCTFRTSGCCSHWGGNNDGSLYPSGSSGGGIIFLGTTTPSNVHTSTGAFRAWSNMNNIKVINNEFLSGMNWAGSASSGTNIGINLGAHGSSAHYGRLGSSSGAFSTNIDISWNRFIGSFSYAAIVGSSSAVSHRGLQITNNYIHNTNLTAKTGTGMDSSGNFGIDINNVTQEGFMAGNWLSSEGSSNVYYIVDPGNMNCVENYGSAGVNVGGNSGVVVPLGAVVGADTC